MTSAHDGVVRPTIAVGTVSHRADDARIYQREIAALVQDGWSVRYVAPEPVVVRQGVQQLLVPRAVGRRRLAAWWHAARALRTVRGEVDLILIHDLELVLPARLAARGTAIVWDVHEDLVQSVADRGWIPPILRPFARLAVALMERAATWGTRLVLAESSYAERLGDWPVVPNTTTVPPTVAPVDDSRQRIVYIGRVSMSRGLETLISVGARLRDECPLEVIGAVDADCRERLEAAAARGDLVWHGYVPNVEALQSIQGALAGLSLLGDHGNYRGSAPTKIYEYLAHGVPFISTPLPLAVDIAEASGGGVIVPFGDVDAVVEAVRRLRSDPDRRNMMARRGHAWMVEHHDWRRDGAQFTHVLRQWIDDGRR